MIVIWENFVKVWTNFGNLIENFKSFKKILKFLKKTLIKFWKNLTKIWNVSFKRFSFSQLKKLYYRVKTFHYKTRQNLGGVDSIEKLSSKIWGGRPPPLPPRLRTPWLICPPPPQASPSWTYFNFLCISTNNEIMCAFAHMANYHMRPARCNLRAAACSILCRRPQQFNFYRSVPSSRVLNICPMFTRTLATHNASFGPL